MKRAFADTFYWIATTDPGDEWHERALQVSMSLGSTRIVTTDAVLIEFVNYFSRYGSTMRSKAAAVTKRILQDEDTEVVAQHRAALLGGLMLYEGRPDKDYSLTDCISMQVMRELGLFEVLTHDQHFAQEGFVVLLR